MKILPILVRTAVVSCFAIILSSASCELFDKVDDVTFDVEIAHTFVVSASATDPLSYSKADEIDPTSNADFNKYKDKIKDVTIHSIEYTVTNFVGDPATTFSNGQGSVLATAGGATALGTASIDVQNISAAQNVKKTLNYSVSQLDAIAAELEDLNSIKFQVSGTVSKVPVAFNVPITIKMTIKADALK